MMRQRLVDGPWTGVAVLTSCVEVEQCRHQRTRLSGLRQRKGTTCSLSLRKDPVVLSI